MKLEIIYCPSGLLEVLAEEFPTVKRAHVQSEAEITEDIADGTLVTIENRANAVLVHGLYCYVIPHDYWVATWVKEKEADIRLDIISNGFMLYQALSDIMEIDRLDMADVQHDEKFKFAQTVLNALNSKK